MAHAQNTPKLGYKSELSPGLKKRFWIGLSVYILSFFVLWSIGDAINSNGYMFRAFLAPFMVISAIVFIIWNFYRKDEPPQS